MELRKYGHSCIRVDAEVDGGRVRLTLDPGTLSDARDALAGADAIVLTHGHPDHLDPEVVVEALGSNTELRLYGPADVVASLRGRPDSAGFADRLVELGPDQELEIAGVPVRTVGGQHALIHPLVRTIDNLGYVIDGAVYHPGDALIVPAGAAELEVLLVPAWAPWSKTADVVDFIAAVRAKRAFSIHDAPLTAAGLKIVGTQLAGLGGRTGTVFEPWANGTNVTV